MSILFNLRNLLFNFFSKACNSIQSFGIIFLVIGFSFSVNGQVAFYTPASNFSTYTPLSSGFTTAYVAPWNDYTLGNAHLATIPFSFNYDGTAYTQCYINPNGYITFGATQPAVNNYTPISSANAYAGAISAFGINLESNGSDIIYGTEGTSPNRVFVVEWKNVVRVGDAGSTKAIFNFQIRLNETTNVINFSYGNSINGTATAPMYAQVGLRGPSNVVLQQDYINRRLTSNVAWNNLNSTVAATNNTFTMLTTNVAGPISGLRFQWTPKPPCVMPAALPTSLVLGTSKTNTSIGGNSFTGASPAPTGGYLVLRSTVNTPPTALQVKDGTFYAAGLIPSTSYTVIQSNASTSFSAPSLSANTTYYFWIIPYSSTCTGAPMYNLTTILTGNATTCLNATTVAAPTSITGTSFVANWNSIPLANNYSIDVSTSSSFSSFVAGYSNLNVGNVTSITVTGLTPATTYYYRVRASISGGCGTNTNIGQATTTCGIFPIPYSQNFDSTPVNTVPNCYTIIDSNSDSTQWGVSTTTFSSASKSLLINPSPDTSLAMNDWFIMPGLNLVGGTTYRLSFYYRTGSATLSENLKVYLGDDAAIANMTSSLLNLSNINNTNFILVYADFTPLISGAYYIGFEGFSSADQSYISVDDINVVVAPTCFAPTNLVASNIGTFSATVSWTAAVPEPSQGYEYYLSTSPTEPIDTTPITGSVGFGINTVDLTGLTTSTTYYIWVRGNCGLTDKSVWSAGTSFTVECTPPTIDSTAPGTRCGFGTVTLGATSSIDSVINWYNSPVSGVPIASGNSFTTPEISATTTYYVEAKSSGAIAVTGPTSPITQGGTIAIQNYDPDGYVNFTVLANTTLQSIDIFPQASGQAGTITLRNSSNVSLISYPFTTVGVSGANAQTIPINYNMLAGESYNLFLEIAPTSGIAMNTDNVFYPITSAAASITGPGVENSMYLGFYNWKFTTECISSRSAIIATITPPPSLTMSVPSSTICDNEATDLIFVNGYSDYDTFVWTPDADRSGTFASGFTFNPTETTNYTLIANNTVSGCSNKINYSVTVLPSPPSVSITPTNVIQCISSVQELKAVAASEFSVTILEQDFNGASNDWIVSQSSLNGDVNDSKWLLKPSSYTYSRPLLTTTFVSNDNSQFYLTNSDSQGVNNNLTCNTTLQSPNFSLVGAATASLNFWHYIRYTGGDKFIVEVSIDGGAIWTPLVQYTNNQGTSTSFADSGIISLNAYIGNPVVTLRFRYNAGWRYFWAIDNVKITADLTSAISWSPATGLFTDAAATTPYILGDLVNDVYAKPLTTSVYTAIVESTNGCKNSNSVTVTVDALTVPGTLASSQVLCSGTAPSNLVLMGYTGSIIRWEYANDAAFTSGVTPIVNTTDTLTAAQMGAFTTIRYFRAVIKSGLCLEVNSNVVSIEYPSTTWNGTVWSNGVPTLSKKAIFNWNYTSSGDLSACAVQINSGTITFLSNTNLIVNNEVNVVSGALIFENDASLVQINNSVNSGNITYKRNTTPVVKFDYTYWSSPVSPQTLVAFSPNTKSDKYLRYNATTQSWISAAKTSTMTSALGYGIRTPDIAPFNTTTRNIFNGLFFGVPNNGDYSVAIVGGVNKMNFIGNPYPSAISADLFLSDSNNATVLDGTIYLWTHNTPITANNYNASDFATYNYTGGVGTGTASPNPGINTSVPNGKIASGQGFFIKGLSNGNAVFKNNMRIIGNNNQFFKMSNKNSKNSDYVDYERNRIWLDIIDDQQNYKQILVGYIEGATNEIDRKFDGDIIDSGNTIMFYSTVNDFNLSIQGRALPFDLNDVVPLGYKSTIANTYTVSLSNFDGLFDSQEVYLEDKLLNLVHNLKNSDYTFSTEAGTFDNRFVLKYTNSSLSTTKSLFNENTVVVYKKDSQWIVDTGNMTMASLVVYDVRGRLLVSKRNIGNTRTTFNAGDTNQVLLVKIISEEGEMVVKKVVN